MRLQYSKSLGTASLTTSQRYIHPLPETIQRAVARLEQYRKTEAAGSVQAFRGAKIGDTCYSFSYIPEAQVVVVGK